MDDLCRNKVCHGSSAINNSVWFDLCVAIHSIWTKYWLVLEETQHKVFGIRSGIMVTMTFFVKIPYIKLIHEGNDQRDYLYLYIRYCSISIINFCEFNVIFFLRFFNGWNIEFHSDIHSSNLNLQRKNLLDGSFQLNRQVSDVWSVRNFLPYRLGRECLTVLLSGKIICNLFQV